MPGQKTTATVTTPAWPRGAIAPGKRAKLTPLLEPGERVLWTGAPDTGASVRTQMLLWWIGVPWTAAAIALHLMGLIPWNLDFFALVTGGVILVSPLLIAVHAGGTIYALTDRRAILMHDGLGKRQTVSVVFEDMEGEFTILPAGEGAGHLYFASGLSPQLADADFDGKLAFRHLRDPERVRDLFERIRAHHNAQNA